MGTDIFIDSKTLNIHQSGAIIGQDQDCLAGCFDHNQNMNGELDEFRIYNRSLSKDEINNLFNNSACYTTIIKEKIVYIKKFVYTSVTDTLFIDVTITSLDNTEKINTIKVFPNPTNEIITIESGDFQTDLDDYSIKIISPDGKDYL